LAFFFLVPTSRWPFIGKEERDADLYFNPRTRRWTKERPSGEDSTAVRLVPGGQSVLRRGLQQLEVEGFGRAERTFVVAWGMAVRCSPRAESSG
jgi:hypothetical protein